MGEGGADDPSLDHNFAIIVRDVRLDSWGNKGLQLLQEWMQETSPHTWKCPMFIASFKTEIGYVFGSAGLRRIYEDITLADLTKAYKLFSQYDTKALVRRMERGNIVSASNLPSDSVID